jgi:hypothetical protein
MVHHDVTFSRPAVGPATLVVAKSLLRVHVDSPVDVRHQQVCRKTCLLFNFMAQQRFVEVLPVDGELSVKAKFFFGRLIKVVSQKT